MNKRHPLIVLLALIAILITACAAPAPVPAEAPEEEAPAAEEEMAEEEMAEGEEEAAAPGEYVLDPDAEPIKIGSSLPLTGPLSIAGIRHQQGYQLCIDLINASDTGLLGRPVEFVTFDNRSEPETTISQYERLINVENVDLMFGTFSSRLTFPASAIAEQYGYVNPVPAGGALRIWEQGFGGIFYFQQVASEYLGYSSVALLLEDVPAEELPTTAAVVNADDFFSNAEKAGLLGEEVFDPGSGELIANLAPGALADAGIEVTFTQTWPEEGYSDWIGLANQVRNADAEALFVLTASPEEAVQMARALDTVGYQPSFLYMSQGTQNEFYENLGDVANGITIHTAWHPEANWEGIFIDQPYDNAQFVEDFTAAYGEPPDEDAAIPFGLCMGITQAVHQLGSTDQAALTEYLHARSAEEPIRTILGEFYWDEKGLPINRSSLVTQWQDGELRFVYPKDEFEGVADLVYPAP